MNMGKNILIVSSCQMRGNTAGLIGSFIELFDGVKNKGCKIDLYDIGFFEGYHNPEMYKVNKYWSIPKRKYERVIRKFPGVRSYYARKIILFQFAQVLKNKHYDLIVLYQIPPLADSFVEITHKMGGKILFVPWGSDILRVSKKTQSHLTKAFANVDFVLGADKSNVVIAAKELYCVPEYKIRITENHPEGIKAIMAVEGKMSKEQMSLQLGLPDSSCNIVCGYNAAISQRHKEIIDAIRQNISRLPSDYQLIFPVTYGGNKTYIEELKQLCANYNLKAFFFTKYMSGEEMAYLHLITDLFIQVQPTDCGNAFMIEALYCKNKIITGRWLKYVQFEQFGIPYYLIDKIEDLSVLLKGIFSNEMPTPKIPQQLVDLFKIPDSYNEYEIINKIVEEA